MNLFRRINATFTSQVNSIVAHVENHDAIVEAALQDARAASAKARIRLMRLRKDGEAMRQQWQELQRMETVWAERAVSVAGRDEQKALECVARRNACRTQHAHTTEGLAKHQALEAEVSASVERIEARLGELTQQRNRLRSRHSAADALRIINRIEGGSAHGIEDVFDQWETRITETEYAVGKKAAADTLETAFAKEENEAALKADLAALLREGQHATILDTHATTLDTKE